MGRYAFVGGKLVDGTGSAPVEDSLVLVEDKKITYAGVRTEIPEGYEVRDIQGRTMTTMIGSLNPLLRSRRAPSSSRMTLSHTVSPRCARLAATVLPSVTW